MIFKSLLLNVIICDIYWFLKTGPQNQRHVVQPTRRPKNDKTGNDIREEPLQTLMTVCKGPLVS